jgi:hypothetical protein
VTTANVAQAITEAIDTNPNPSARVAGIVFEVIASTVVAPYRGVKGIRRGRIAEGVRGETHVGEKRHPLSCPRCEGWSL